MTAKVNHPTDEQYRCWRPRAWCASAGIGRSKLYALPASQQPHGVRIGRARVITESPQAWALRVGSPV